MLVPGIAAGRHVVDFGTYSQLFGGSQAGYATADSWPAVLSSLDKGLNSGE